MTEDIFLPAIVNQFIFQGARKSLLQVRKNPGLEAEEELLIANK